MMNWPAIIRGLTGMNQEEYNQMEYQAGREFLELMESDNPELMAYLERSYIFWNWWRRQFWRLGREFINRNGIEACRATSQNIVREKLEAYCSIVKVSDYGVSSYSYLVTEAQRTLKGKQQKSNHKISADNGNNDSN